MKNQHIITLVAVIAIGVFSFLYIKLDTLEYEVRSLQDENKFLSKEKVTDENVSNQEDVTGNEKSISDHIIDIEQPENSKKEETILIQKPKKPKVDSNKKRRPTKEEVSTEDNKETIVVKPEKPKVDPNKKRRDELRALAKSITKTDEAETYKVEVEVNG